MTKGYVRRFSLKDSLSYKKVGEFWKHGLHKMTPAVDKISGVRSNRTILGALALLAMGLIALSSNVSFGQAQTANPRVYELRTYTALPGRLSALHKRFADHTIRIFERHGMKSEMYWTPTDEPLKDNTLIYILSHESREAADKNWKEFQADPEWIKVRDESEADGKILAKPPERVFMTLTPFSPTK